MTSLGPVPTPQVEALENWHRQHGGYLSPSMRLSYSLESGIHWRAIAAIEPATLILSVPHSLALSYLNALVDEKYPFFKQRRNEFGGIEAIGFWYLMIQWLNRRESFWQPYLDTLPDPASDLSTPLFFEAEEDLAWIEATDVLHTARQRIEVYDRQYQKGSEILGLSGIDMKPYTWHMYKWAVTMFTSRSFSSRAIHSSDSKYWTTYRTGPDGRRQTVILDMSGVPAADLDFPVLFPTMDAGNHDPNTPVYWAYDPGRFSVTIGSHYETGQEVFNNYSALKSNAELLLGYGFCISDNVADVVMLTLKAPPVELQQDLQKVHPGYFLANGEWSGDKATFYLPRPTTSSSDPKDIIKELPEPLLELLLYMLRHDRGLPFTFTEHPMQFVTSRDSLGRRYLPHVARAVVQSIAPKLQKLQSIALPTDPQNYKQRQTAIYRGGQVDILSAMVSSLRTYTRSYLDPGKSHGPRLVTVEGLLQIWAGHVSETTIEQFLDGIEVSAGSRDLGTLRSAGWEDDVAALLLCAVFMEGSKNGILDLWTKDLLPEYIDESSLTAQIDVRQMEADSQVSPANDLLELVTRAAASSKEETTLWKDPRWSTKFITEIGGKILQFDSMLMMVPNVNDADVGEEARMVVYLHTA